MAIRRRDRHADQPALTPDVDLGAVADTVQDLAGAALGARPALAEGPEAVLAGFGRQAYKLRLATDDPAWAGELVARDADDAVLAHEAAWLRGMRTAGFPVPDLVTDPPGDVLVFRSPGGVSLAEKMLTDMAAIPTLIASFTQLQARLHALPTTGLPDAASDPLDELEARATSPKALDAISTELGWLRRKRPEAATVVPCHSELNPVHVWVADGDNTDLTAVSWTQARLADPAYDVAATVTAFWAAAIYLDNAIYRKAMEMARGALIDVYLDAYKAAASEPLDDFALRYWQVFHLTGLVADATRRLHDDIDGPWDAATAISQPADTIEEIRTRIRDCAAG